MQVMQLLGQILTLLSGSLELSKLLLTPLHTLVLFGRNVVHFVHMDVVRLQHPLGVVSAVTVGKNLVQAAGCLEFGLL